MDTILAPNPHSSRRSWRGVAIAIAIGLAIVVAFVAVSGLVRDPTTVPRLEIHNQTDDLVDVLARGRGSDALLPVAIVEPHRSAVSHDVVDQGDTWTFVVRASGRTVARIPMTRGQLERADWVVTIPAPGG